MTAVFTLKTEVLKVDEDRNIENPEENKVEKATVVRKVVRRSETQPREQMRVVAPRTTFVRKVTVSSNELDENSEKVTGNSESKHIVSQSLGYTMSPISGEKMKCKYSRIILVGMPCSGKTSIGRSVATICDYTFYDMDEYIEQSAGKTIPEIFAEKDGEATFRALETKAAAELGKMENVIIATGGGAVTREETMKNLCLENSFTIFIHREFYKIATTPQRVMDKRPLFENTSFEALLATYKFRLPLYRKYANIEVENDKNREDAVSNIKKVIME